MKANSNTPSRPRKPSSRFLIGLGAPLAAAALLLCASPAQAVNYAGNGNTDFGGTIGTGTLTLTDDGTNINGTLTTSGTMNNVLVIYIETGPGGFASTSGFSDANDGLRKAISGFNGGTTRSLLTFTNGFAPNYAIALGPLTDNYGGLWQLANGGGGSLSHITSVNLTPTGSGTGPFAFSLPCSAIGLTAGVPATIKIFGTYISNTGYRSTEAIAGNATGTQGWNPFTQTAYASYDFNAGAPVSYPVTFSVDMSVQIASGAFSPDSGDTVYAAGTFQSPPWSGFQLYPDVSNTNIYTGTALDANPLGSAEQYKFRYHSVVLGLDFYEGIDNRPFTLATSQSLPLVYFDDLAPGPGTNLLTFRIDVTPLIDLGRFDPLTDVMEVRGTFQTPDKWAAGFMLTNDPSGPNTNLYSGTYPDGNYPGTWENYKFVYVRGTATYEDGNNRSFFTPSGPYTFPIAYFNNISNTYSIPVTFQVDMTVPLLAGLFNPGNGDSVGAAGSFQEPSAWVVGAEGFLLTNNPAGGNPNLYSGTYVDKHAPASIEQYKFVINTNGGGTAYEAINNRSFVLASGTQALPAVFWNDLSTNNVLLTDTYVTFGVNMNGAVDRFGAPFDPANDTVFVNGDFIHRDDGTLWWDWTDPLLGSPDHMSEYQLTETPPSSGIYVSAPIKVPAGNSLALTYKYGIYHNTSAANTNADNEAGFALNHVRYIRNPGNYTLPTDIFGLQQTNQPAAIEPSFGDLGIGTASGGYVPVSWLGRPGVYLQTTTNVVGGAWQTHPETTGLLTPTTYGVSATNWPNNGKALYFRLVNPY